MDGISTDGKPCKGIIVRGAKICNSNAPYVDEIIVNPTNSWDRMMLITRLRLPFPGTGTGVKLMALPGLHHKRTHIEAPFANIGDVESYHI